MTKETKNILTWEDCQKKLMRWAKGELFPHVVLLGIVSLALIPFFIWAAFMAKRELVLGILLGLLCATGPIALVYRITCDVKQIGLVKQGSFSVVRDTVFRISRGETPRNSKEGRDTVDVVYFERYGRCTSLNTPFDFSAVGDEFYLVILHAKRDEIIFAYHSAMYDYTTAQADI